MSMFDDELAMPLDDMEYEFEERDEEECEYEEGDNDHPLAGIIFDALVRNGYDRCEALAMVYAFSDAFAVGSAEAQERELKEIAFALGSDATTVEGLEQFLWGMDDPSWDESDETEDEQEIEVEFRDTFDSLLIIAHRPDAQRIRCATRAFQKMGADAEKAYRLALVYTRYSACSDFRFREIAARAALSAIGIVLENPLEYVEKKIRESED